MALLTGADYLAQARRILNDQDAAAYRYTDDTLLEALEAGVNDMDRLRPDILLGVAEQNEIVPTTSLVFVDRRYRRALLDYVVGYAESVDDEAATNERATKYRAMFVAALTGFTL